MHDDARHLGGRLPLLREEDLTPGQRDVRERLLAVQVPEAKRSGFAAQTSDGRFIGPFNAYIRFDGPGGALLDWAAAQVRTNALTPAARQIVTLAVGAVWKAPFEVQAHVAAARSTGISDAAIDAVLDGRDHPDLASDARAARALAAALLVDHKVDDDLYSRSIAVIGEGGIAAVAHLVGQYVAVSALLISFDVPTAPPTDSEE